MKLRKKPLMKILHRRHKKHEFCVKPRKTFLTFSACGVSSRFFVSSLLIYDRRFCTYIFMPPTAMFEFWKKRLTHSVFKKLLKSLISQQSYVARSLSKWAFLSYFQSLWSRKRGERKKFEKILKKCRSNRPLLLLAKCTSLLAGFFSSSSGTKRDCSVAGSFLRLLEKELKNRGAKRKIGSEVGEILTQTLLSWDEVENQVVFQPVVWPNSHINIKGIDNNDYRVSQQVFTKLTKFHEFLYHSWFFPKI